MGAAAYPAVMLRPQLRSLVALLVLLVAGTAARAEEADYDVVVIGGGPAGTVAALQLANQGHRVLMVEKRGRERLRGQVVGLKQRAANVLGKQGAPLHEDSRARYVDKPGHEVTPVETDDADPVAEMAASFSSHTIKIGKLETMLHEKADRHDGLDLQFNAELAGAPAQSADGIISLQVSQGGAVRPVRAKYVVVTDGAGMSTLKSLGIASTVHARSKVAAAVFAQKGRNLIDYAPGVARLGDENITYTLTAIGPADEKATPAELEKLVRERGKQVGIARTSKLTKIWTFDAQMQRAETISAFGCHLLVLGDASATPHPLTGMGANKAIVEAEHTASTIASLMRTTDEPERRAIVGKWRSFMEKSTRAIHTAALPIFDQFGTVDEDSTYVRSLRRSAGAKVAAKLPPRAPGQKFGAVAAAR